MGDSNNLFYCFSAIDSLVITVERKVLLQIALSREIANILTRKILSPILETGTDCPFEVALD